MKTLSEEQKVDLAKQMLSKWLDEPCVPEQQVKDAEVIKIMRTTNEELRIAEGYSSSYKRVKECTDEDLRKSSQYRERMESSKRPSSS